MNILIALKKFLKDHKEVVAVSLILFLAAFFRFYKLSSFQYWSTDDEIFSAVVTRMIFGHKITLVSPNATLGVSLGSFFHIISIGPYFLARFNASVILAFGSALGVATTALMYLAGKEIGGRRVGIFASFLYATSFLASFTDRRWWPLTPDAILATLAIFSLVKMVKGKLRWSLGLTIAASFAWHSDPTLLVVSVAALISFAVFRFPIFSKAYIPAIIYLIISIAPFFIFELRHPAAISHPIDNFVTGSRSLTQGSRANAILRNDIVGNFTRALFLAPTNDLEAYLLYCETCKQPPFGFLTRTIGLVFLVLPIFLWRKNPFVRPAIVYIAAFITGIIIFSLVFGTAIYLHFYTVVWPAFFLLAGVSLNYLWFKKMKLPVIALLLSVFIFNFNMILNSQMKYPLRDKLAAANYAISKVWSKPFSLVVDVDQRRLDGMGGLFYLKNLYPANASYYEGWNWIYMAYSLYGTRITEDDPVRTIIISPKSSPAPKAFKSKTFGNIRASFITE